MADKEILAVEIDDSAFSEFKRKFDEYQTAVKALPTQWQKSGIEITAQKTNFEKMVKGAEEQNRSIAAAETSQGQFNRLLDATGLTFGSLHKSGKMFAGNIVHATQSLMHWTKLTAVFSGLLGAGGLFGINRMAASVAAQRTSAAGLGVTYGEQASFLTNFGRLGNAEGILQGFSQAEVDVSKKYALRQYLGHTESGDPAKDFAEGLGRFKQFVDQYKDQPGLLGPMLHARGYDKLGIGTEQARIVQGMSADEVAQIARGYRGDVAGRLGLSDADAKKWTDFSNQMERAGLEIETVFAKRTVGLAKPLEHLSESFVHLTENLLKDGSPISGWIKDLGRGIRNFADELGSGAAQAMAADLGRNIADTVKLFDAILAKAPNGLAVLLGIGVGARFGGAAAAAGGALARSGAIGTLGAGAAAAGAMGATMYPQPLNEGEDERARQKRFHQGSGGHPLPPGVFPEKIPAKPGSLSDKSAIWMGPTASAAPLGPGMGRYNFMHGQFGGPGQNLTRITTSGGHTATVNKESAPHFLGFLNDIEAAGAPIHQKLLGGYNDRNIAGRHTKSQHAYGNAVDIDSTGRNIVTPDFAAWARAHDKELRAAEGHWGIRAGRDMSNPDMGHWEWGGGAGSGGSSPRRGARFGHPHGVGHHPATVGRQQQSMIIEDHTGGMVSVDSGRLALKDLRRGMEPGSSPPSSPLHAEPPPAIQYRKLQNQPGGIQPTTPPDSMPSMPREYA